MTRADRPATHATPYIGRFAPSPSGPLHMGSLVCALASFLDAKARRGKWLVRIEDIDPPRQRPGADKIILDTLLAHGLTWDSEIRYQSQHTDRYNAVLSHLAQNGLSYRCTCTRKRVAALGGVYDQHCLGHHIPHEKPHAIRLNVAAAHQKLHIKNKIVFEDGIQLASKNHPLDDIIIRRKDGLFAYQLAVVVDDIAQGITDIVRGFDLFDMTASQILLTRLLGAEPPRYAHIPLLIGEDGCKLSKQSHAPAIDNRCARDNVIAALRYLQHPPPRALDTSPMEHILAWAIDAWTMTQLSMMKSVTLTPVNQPSLNTVSRDD